MEHGILKWTEKVYTDVEFFYYRSVELNFCLFASRHLSWTGCEAGISSTKPSTPSPNKVTYHISHITHYTLHITLVCYKLHDWDGTMVREGRWGWMLLFGCLVGLLVCCKGCKWVYEWFVLRMRIWMKKCACTVCSALSILHALTCLNVL